MSEQRLVKVLGSLHLEDQFEPQAGIVVRLAAAVTHRQRLDCEAILRIWGHLASYACMPDEGLVASMARETIFRSYGGLKYFQVEWEAWTTLRCFVGWGGVSPDWLDVLLNGLESFHVQEAVIESIELKDEGV